MKAGGANAATPAAPARMSGLGQVRRIPGHVDRPMLGRIRWYTPFLLLPVPVLIILGLQVRDTLDEPAVANGACSVGTELASKSVYLIDLRKPVDAAYASLPGDLLREVSIEVPVSTELSVYAVSPYAEAPRTLIGRLCKPYDNADLVVEAAKDGGSLIRDCDDLPAQISGSLRTSATGFCRQREVLGRRIDALVAQVQGRTATDAYLVEALEETSRDLDGSSVPASLYVFSDMKQHAKWYSHLDVAWNEWSFEQLVAARDVQPNAVEPVGGTPAGLPVKVFYVARMGTTDQEQPRLSHKQFWQDFFGGAELAFEDQPTMAGYAAESLMDIPTPMELAAYEREQIRHRSEIVERERAFVEGERAFVEGERAKLEASRQAFEKERERFAERQRQILDRERQLAERQQQFTAQERELEASKGKDSREVPNGAQGRAEATNVREELAQSEDRSRGGGNEGVYTGRATAATPRSPIANAID